MSKLSIRDLTVEDLSVLNRKVTDTKVGHGELCGPCPLITCLEDGSLSPQQAHCIARAAGITPLVIIPRANLHKVTLKNGGQSGIED